jgi:hypothetical protein
VKLFDDKARVKARSYICGDLGMEQKQTDGHWYRKQVNDRSVKDLKTSRIIKCQPIKRKFSYKKTIEALIES